MKTIITAAVAAIAVAVAVPTAAGPVVSDATGHWMTTVHYRDLDLRSAAGRATLQKRLAAAAARVCRGGNDFDALQQAIEVVRCRHDSVAQAMASVPANVLVADAAH